MTDSRPLAPSRSAQDEFFALAERAQAADGQPPFNDQTLADVRTGAAEPIPVRAEGQLVAAAVRRGDEFELVVDPEHRGRRIGGDLARSIARDSAPGTLTWAHGDHPASRVLARELGFERVRTLLQLRVPLADVRTREGAAEGFTVRPFHPSGDEEEWVRLNALVFASHPEQGAVTVADLRAREAEPWFDADDFLLAVDEDGTLIGYDWVKVDPAEPGIGEIYVLGVHPDASGRGVGRVLLQAGLQRMRDRGASIAALYVESDNESAVALYRSAGFAEHSVDVQYRLR